jgi:CRISPR-associated protein Cmr6
MTHAGLLLIQSPGTQDGKIPDPARPERLDAITRCPVPSAYDRFYAVWSAALQSLPAARSATATTTSRILIGHGLTSAHEVGLTLHHTYGTPVIPGSALKGVLAHYVHRTIGAADERWRGPMLDDDGRVVDDPGVFFRTLFGAAPSEGDEQGYAGVVAFHDALMHPGPGKPLAADVLTPHQTEYYRDASADPNDYTSPIPVGFISVKPGVRFDVWLSGDDAGWVGTAATLLEHALREHGVGGKTSSGYGRLEVSFKATPEELAQRKEAETLAREAEERERAQQARAAQRAAIEARMEDLTRRLATGPAELDGLFRFLKNESTDLDARDLGVWIASLTATETEWLHAKLPAWLASIGCGPLGEAYVAERTRLGLPFGPQERSKDGFLWKVKADPRHFELFLEVDGSRQTLDKPHIIESDDGRKLRSKEFGFAVAVTTARPEAPNVKVVFEGNKVKKVYRHG